MAKLKTIRQVLDSVKRRFKDSGIATFKLDAELLLAKVLGCQRIDLYLNLEKPLSKSELEKYKELSQLRLKHYPIAYIMKKKEFMSLEFFLEEGIFIPRPDSEILVEWIIENIPSHFNNQQLQLADFCAGSGCLGISSLYYLKQKGIKGKVDFYEKNDTALKIIRKNASLYLEKEEYSIFKKDILNESIIQKYDLIISNPPYISREEMESLMMEVKNYHFRESLTDEKDGLTFYKYLAQKGSNFLTPKGFLIIEIGYNQKDKVKKLFLETNKFSLEAELTDLEGRDRGLVWRKI